MGGDFFDWTIVENGTALPNAEPAAASPEEIAAAQAIDQDANAGELAEEKKPEKTPEQREIDRLRRGIDRRTRQLSDARAQLDLTRAEKQSNYQHNSDDSEPLSLTRAEIAELVKAEAHKLAPTIRAQASEAERRASVVQSIEKSFGKERFDAVTEDLDKAFDGLSDASGRAKPAIEAIFEADEPAKVIEYLADPENDEEAEAISRMSAAQAGKAIAKLEARLAAKPKPTQVSKAAAPLDPVRRSSAMASSGLSDELTSAEWLSRRNRQLRERNN